MKYTIVKYEELLAMLKPSQFRPFKDAILKKEFKQYLNHIFKDKDRIYLPFNPVKGKIVIPLSIQTYLRENEYEIVNYEAGIVKKKNVRNLSKIGKVLTKAPNSKQLLDRYNVSISNVRLKKEYLVVISRHPYDIAGMSTGRRHGKRDGWTSCMHLEEGASKHYVTKDIEHGTLVAYIVNTEDENINKPLSRLLIKQFINIKDPSDTILYPETKVYGIDIPGFRKVLLNWIKTFQTLHGTYLLNPELNYDGIEAVGEGDKHSDSVGARFLYYKNNPSDKDAKKDVFNKIRQLYYDNFPEDSDASTDRDYYIKQKWEDAHPKPLGPNDFNLSDLFEEEEIEDFPEDEIEDFPTEV